MTDKHIHDCTGHDATCPCGYQLRIPRFSFDMSLYDGETKQHLLSECFSTDDIWAAIDTLREAADTLDRTW